MRVSGWDVHHQHATYASAYRHKRGPFRELVASSSVCLILRMGWGKVEGSRNWIAKDFTCNCEALWLYFALYTVEGH